MSKEGDLSTRGKGNKESRKDYLLKMHPKPDKEKRGEEDGRKGGNYYQREENKAIFLLRGVGSKV